jgi:hypothetical protein
MSEETDIQKQKDTWMAAAEAALEKTREALIRARHEQDFENWDELCDAQECLQAAVESEDAPKRKRAKRSNEVWAALREIVERRRREALRRGDAYKADGKGVSWQIENGKAEVLDDILCAMNDLDKHPNT